MLWGQQVIGGLWGPRGDSWALTECPLVPKPDRPFSASLWWGADELLMGSGTSSTSTSSSNASSPPVFLHTTNVAAFALHHTQRQL